MVFRLILLGLIIISLNSCRIYFKESNQLGQDYKLLSSEDFAKKYYTLYSNSCHDTTSIKSNVVYVAEENNFTKKYFVFLKDNYVYDSNVISFNDGTKNVNLNRSAYYTVCDSVIKIEWIAQSSGSVYTIINEGVIRNDKIVLFKEYTGRGKGDKRIIKKLYPNYDIKYYKLYDKIVIFPPPLGVE